jgi:hypothetical protein
MGCKRKLNKKIRASLLQVAEGQRGTAEGGAAPPRAEHEQLGCAAAEKLDGMTPGERRRWQAQLREERRRRG